MNATSTTPRPPRYADPQRCPDCRGPITTGVAACPTCGLVLTGELPQRLFTTLLSADELLGRLRDLSASTAATSPTGATAAPFDPLPLPARPAEAPRRSRLSAATVPQVLLALGGACVLVAALVFLAVAWSVLGVGGRTVVLVALTVVAASVAAVTARRGLRGATESLAVVAAGLLTLDIFGARNAGWLGDVSDAGFLVALGSVLTATGLGAALAARRTAVRRLLGLESIAALGVLLATVGVGNAAWLPRSPMLLAATLVAIGSTALAHRLALRITLVGGGMVAGGAWLTMTGAALGRTLDAETWRALWLELEVWPLLVAAALTLAPVLHRRVPQAVRVGLAAIGQTLLVTAALAPALLLAPTTGLLTGVGVLVAAALATHLLPRSWAYVSSLTQALVGASLGGVVLLQSAAALGRVGETAAAAWTGRPSGTLRSSGSLLVGLPAAWTLPFTVLVLLATGWTLWAANGRRRAVVTEPVVVAAAAVLAFALLGALALYPVPVWLLLAATLVVALTFAGAWWVLGVPSALGAATALLAGALALSLYDEWLSAAALTVSLLVATTVHLRSRSAEVAAVAGATLAALVGALVWTTGALLDGAGSWVAVAGLGVLGALVLAAPYAPSSWWRTPGLAFAVVGLEAGAAATAVPLALAGVVLAPVSQEASWTAVYLTVGGAVVSAMSLLREDRRMLGWIGGLLLAAASWVRLADLGVQEPEAYTLPSALALLLVGLWHLRRHDRASTMTALAPGLSLALVPSLLWVLVDPTGLRVLLLGLACLGLVLAGARVGWTAPIALGAAVGALLVLRLAAPYVGDAVPRWVLLGAAGALLIVVGATWERRLQEARHVVGYVRALR